MAAPGKNKKKKGEAPSKEDAELALDFIKTAEKQTEEDEAKKKAEETRRLLEEAEKEKIRIAQEKVKRLLREKLKQKELKIKEDQINKFLESGKKVKWKSLNQGKILQGYVKEKLVFEIQRGLTLFSLYIKDQKLIENKKTKTYQGCSTNLQVLKAKSEKFI